MRKTRPVAVALAALVLVSGLSACGGKNRWCEHDATDRRVADSYCERGVAGYEWETGSDKKKNKKVKKVKKTRSRR
ncbi:hypothetical protein FHX41_5982 [Actinomadura hallensis]|uniref:Lipoprotein n=1 Tax=Actinomadura hallensis TaxID=337895 RepID=A0A543INU4_9ACTN|nr:hypothetical protein [Actinomadura hallensis]TQM72188.1 hypothetical protein FHX41_5982 [Actinomadura hallensis]HLV73148.1 hypothetical protein [Vulgatibacteraceae bacterium]